MTSDQAVSNDAPHPNHGVVKSRIAGGLLASIVLVVFAAANLPYQYVESEMTWVGYLEVADGVSIRLQDDMPVMAGWPLRYLVRYDDHGSIQDRVWLPNRLLINVGLGVLFATGVYLFFRIRERKLIEKPDSHFLRYFFDCCLALAILAVPGVIFGWQYRETNRDLRLARQLAQAGSSSLSCWLPRVLDPHVPSALKRHFVRIRDIHIYGADQQLAQRIVSAPALLGLHSYAGEFDARPLRQLTGRPHFGVLQLSRQELGDEHVDAITKLRWLRQLRLSRTNLNVGQLAAFDDLPLRIVDLSFTEVPLDQIGKPGWHSTVEALLLSRPPDDVAGSLNIEGWPALRELRVERQSNYMNEAVLSIRLVDLPRLERLCIDRVQKHDLVLKNLPRLLRVDEEVAELRFVLSSDALIPGLPWVRSLEIDGADSLSEFGCFARDLEAFSIRRTKGLRKFMLGSFYTTLLGEVTPLTVDGTRCQQWLRQLGAMPGPSQLDLSFLPLEGMDLSPLGDNARVRHLRLANTGVTFAQIQQLEGMEQIKSLNIRSTPLQQEDLAWLLDRFPKLEDLTSDVTGVSRFDLRGRGQLREVQITPMETIEEIRVADLPQLRTSIRLTRSPEVLEISNVPGLRGLAVEGPWPTNAKFNGLRDLEWFTGGGAGITDEVANEVLNCDALDRLTFAYPSVSKDVLRRIGNLKELTFLALPGAAVDDDLIDDWDRLTSLWEVNLDDTKISVKTIAWLSRMESLRRLSLKRVPLSEAAIDALAELKQVSELQLAGVSMPAEKLRPLLRRGSLESLDLSGWEFNEQLIDVICSDGTDLKHIVVGDSVLDQASYARIMEVAPSLFLQTNSLPSYVDGTMLAELHRRAGSLSRDMNTGWRLMLRPRDDVFQSMPWQYRSAEALAPEKPEGLPDVRATYMSRLDRQMFGAAPAQAN